MHPTESDRPLIVYLDIKSPYAYLAWQPTRDLAAQLGIKVDWRPFVLDIPSYLGSAKLDKKGKVATANRSEQQWSGVKYAYFDCRRYANLRELTVRGTVKIWNTDLTAVSYFLFPEEFNFHFYNAFCQNLGGRVPGSASVEEYHELMDKLENIVVPDIHEKCLHASGALMVWLGVTDEYEVPFKIFKF